MALREIIICEYNSPCGLLRLGDYDGRLCMCDWSSAQSHHLSVCNRLSRNLDCDFAEGRTSILDAAASQLDEYFSRSRKKFDIPLLMIGTDFQKMVWNCLSAVSYGDVSTYKEVATNCCRPEAVRAVAGAIGANALSIFIPCHRIIGSSGSLTGYAGGLQAKNCLLALEGV